DRVRTEIVRLRVSRPVRVVDLTGDRPRLARGGRGPARVDRPRAAEREEPVAVADEPPIPVRPGSGGDPRRVRVGRRPGQELLAVVAEHRPRGLGEPGRADREVGPRPPGRGAAYRAGVIPG